MMHGLIVHEDGSVEVASTAWHGLSKMGYKERVHCEELSRKLSVKLLPGLQNSGIGTYQSNQYTYIQIG